MAEDPEVARLKALLERANVRAATATITARMAQMQASRPEPISHDPLEGYVFDILDRD